MIIAGSRSINDYPRIVKILEKHKHEITEIVCGLAAGVDNLGKRYSEINKIPLKVFPAEWEKHGKSAGYKRNLQMAEYADALIAVWDGKSKGTKHMIDIMQKKLKPVFIYV